MKRNKLHRLSALILALICVACCFIIPTVAEDAPNWGDETPYFSDYMIMSTNSDWNNAPNMQAIRALVGKAYKIGLFGGAFPLAIVVDTNYRPNTNTLAGVSIVVACVMPATIYFDSDSELKDSASAFISGSSILFETPTGSLFQSGEVSAFRLCANGCWAERYMTNFIGVSDTTLIVNLFDGAWSANWGSQYWVDPYATGSVHPSISQISAAYDYILGGGGIGGDDFDRGYAEGYDVGYDAGYDDGWDDGYPVGEGVGYQNGYTTGYGEGYDVGYDWGIVEAQPVTLNIPELITAIPTSAKAIINNSFGFELFGINIAGFLSLLLVIAIVGFIVKWLMTR